MTKFLSKEISDIYKELLNQFNEYKNKEFAFTSYINYNSVNFSENNKWKLLNEIDINTQTYFDNYYFVCICSFDSLEFIDWAYKKVPENEKNLKEFGKEGEGCFVLKMQIKNIISMRYNFWPYTKIKKNAYINILVNYKDVSYINDCSGNIYNVNFDKTFLDIIVDKDNEIIMGNDSTNIYTYSYNYSKEDTRFYIINKDLLDMSRVYSYLDKEHGINSLLDLDTAKKIIYKLSEERKVSELMELEELIVSILRNNV
jgi:hypothetical protein